MLAAIPLRASIVIVAHAAEPSAAAIEEVIVHVQGLASDDLLRDLELRSPGLALKLQAPGQPLELPSERPWAYVLARAVDDGAAITVILADGRAYDRRVSAAADQAPRATASALANLLAAIVEDRVAPDRQDVTPTAALREATDGAETPEPEPEPAPEREPAPEPAPEPEPEPKPVTPPQDTKPRWSIIPELAPIFALQLGPPSDTGVVGGGGIGLGLGLRGPRGARVGLDLRGLWNGGQSLAVHRYRVGVRGGYELRRGRFVLVTDALFGVEPWLARADGRRVDVGASADDSAPAVALALGARVLPAIDLGLGTGGHTRLRLGLQAELAYTGVVDEGLRAARITLSDGADEARLRLGGLELALGLLIAIPHDLGGR